MTEVSALGPIDPSSVATESEHKAPWIMRKLVGSMTGRIVMSSYESLRAAGTSVICLSPWGDSSPFLLPCIRFRDLAVHFVIVATGGTASIVSPAMGPVSDLVIGSVGDSILVEIGLHEGFVATTKLANDLVFDKTAKAIIPTHSKRLETTSVKELTITLKFHHTIDDAALGFFRSSIHQDSSLFSSVKDYLSVEKGWFSPYLFASARRPIIPRSMQPDVVFCHGPFLEGDYRVGEILLKESALTIVFAETPAPPEMPKTDSPTEDNAVSKWSLSNLHLPALSNRFARSRTPSPQPGGDKSEGKSQQEPTPKLTLLPPPQSPRRMVITVVGLKPHRHLWTTSARPGESVIRYMLLNGCPAVVVPVKLGAPLVAWDTLTLEQLSKIELPDEGKQSASGKFEGIVDILSEFLDLCIDWDRVTVGSEGIDDDAGVEAGDLRVKKDAVKGAITLLVAAAIRSNDSKAVQKDLDAGRAGVGMWRIP
ncbi:hypothetical protein CYLTODRAFT_391427 [Cylindrobasidium torrendii FP15055 ss-10]|uniref:Uncharacterized protein n=1 Tax=Cylindrobasidium torrendii FP15055 ss-10 TaxID=1314674 RepID=A0A0D7BK02_9AGAR|nr:hypothetical protein CYLTODRAFT_391427 [Cylindrobasidium torrendii FP15055 ss-10]